jgi:hypothetical protein
MKRLAWFERRFTFGLPAGMLPFYLERLSGTAIRIADKVKGISEDILSEKVDGKWSVKQNIGHLAEVDAIALQRIDQMLAGISMMLPAVFEPRDYSLLPVREVLQYFEENRGRNLVKYKSLRDEDLIKASLHPRLKLPMTPVDLAYFDAEHDDHHLVTIHEILEAKKR